MKDRLKTGNIITHFYDNVQFQKNRIIIALSYEARLCDSSLKGSKSSVQGQDLHGGGLQHRGRLSLQCSKRYGVAVKKNEC